MIREDEYITKHYGTDGLFIPAVTDPDVSLDGINYIPDLENFVYQFIPERYRPYLDNASTIVRRKLYDYLISVAKVLEKDNESWNNIRKAIYQRLNWNSQTLLFQQNLRDVFENDDIPGLWITDSRQSSIEERDLGTVD